MDHWKMYLLSQWLNFKLLGIPYLVGKIKFKLFFQGPLAKWVYFLHKNWIFHLREGKKCNSTVCMLVALAQEGDGGEFIHKKIASDRETSQRPVKCLQCACHVQRSGFASSMAAAAICLGNLSERVSTTSPCGIKVLLSKHLANCGALTWGWQCRGQGFWLWLWLSFVFYHRDEKRISGRWVTMTFGPKGWYRDVCRLVQTKMSAFHPSANHIGVACNRRFARN